MRRPLALAAIIAGLAITALPARAQDFPTKPINFVVPYTAGGPYDTITRYLADSIRKQKLSQPAIVEAKPGGNTIVGIQSVLNAPADGHTLLISTSPINFNLVLMKNPGYKAEDFIPVAAVAKHPYVAYAPGNLPANNMKELSEYATKNPGKLNVGVLAPGGLTQLLGDRVISASKLKMEKIPYKGGAELATALLTGDIQLAFTTYSAGEPFLKDGRLKAIGIAQDERSTLAPQIPTFKEMGYPSVSGEAWVGLFARAGTPPATLAKLRKIIAEATSDPEYIARIRPLGIEPWVITPDKIGDYIKEDAKTWEPDLKALGDPQ